MSSLYRVSYDHDVTPDAAIGHGPHVVGNAAYFADEASAQQFRDDCVAAWEDDEITADDYTIEPFQWDWIDDDEIAAIRAAVTSGAIYRVIRSSSVDISQHETVAECATREEAAKYIADHTVDGLNVSDEIECDYLRIDGDDD